MLHLNKLFVRLKQAQTLTYCIAQGQHMWAASVPTNLFFCSCVRRGSAAVGASKGPVGLKNFQSSVD